MTDYLGIKMIPTDVLIAELSKRSSGVFLFFLETDDPECKAKNSCLWAGDIFSCYGAVSYIRERIKDQMREL